MLYTDSREMCQELHNLEGSKKERIQSPSTEGEKYSMANLLNKYLAGVSKSSKRKVLDRVLWSMHKKKVKAPSLSQQPFEQNFSLLELNRAIKKAAPRKAPGPDRVTNEMISYLGDLARQKLLLFINRTWNEGKLPTDWRTAKVTPILKKGKPSGQPQSYRPISLTSCLEKVTERMINNRLYH